MTKKIIAILAFVLLAMTASAAWDIQTWIGGEISINGQLYEILNVSSGPQGALTFTFLPVLDPSCLEEEDPVVAEDHKRDEKGSRNVEVGFSGGWIDENGTEHEDWDSGYIM